MASILVEPEADEFDVHPTVGTLSQPYRKVRGLMREEWAEYAIAFASGLHLALLIRYLLDWNDVVGTATVSLIAGIALHYAIVRQRSSAEVAMDKAMTTVMWSIGLLTVTLLVWMVTFVTRQGLKRLRWGFLTQDLKTVSGTDQGGGAFHALVGSIQQVSLATVVVVPIAVLTAVYLHEIRGRMSTVIRFVVDMLAGLPSIVAGLLVITIFPGYAGYKASIALAILALPIVTRTSEEVLRTVPDGLREASLALGAPQWRVVGRIVLPTARAGLVTAFLLAVARMVGETAPVLLTAFLRRSTNKNLFAEQPQASLPTFVWDLIRVPDKLQIERAWAGALLLLIIVLIFFAAARFALARSEKRLGRR